MNLAGAVVLNVFGLLVLAALWRFVIRSRLDDDRFRAVMVVVFSVVLVWGMYLVVQEARSR
jgi:hypothetical protein